ncbi:hypothetical protein CHLRE_09g387500v5 [Chlamydomonas reinhardtii]|uniref:Tbc2 translation factor, chloroplastic n=1 Tax=Chlamydomonas reinhardtii TaxID=3055 RepID=A0A2K3DDQ3_CHLRE|nr:uncharacterized protein CHLRE_09g387500v5 [Chlamydomonas reinhardtii]PNW78670.1 hypothetical protein CHLRE_09g387500v5 [Chlamydomonas reinhardtii]
MRAGAGRLSAAERACAASSRVILAPLASSTASTSGRVHLQDVAPVTNQIAAGLHKPGHQRTARISCAAAQRGHVASTSTSTSSVPSQFILLTECGSPPSAADVQEVLPHLTPKQLADAVWCFAQHEVKPTAELMDAVAQEIHSKLAHFRAQDLSNTLWAFAMLKYQPTEIWWQDFERQVYGALTDLTDRQLANLLWAFAVLERRPVVADTLPAAASASASTSSSAVGCADGLSCSGAAAGAGAAASGGVGCSAVPQVELLAASERRSGWVLDPLLAHSCARGFSGYSAGSLHLLVWSLGKLHHPPPAAWLEGFLPAAESQFFRFSPTELSNIIWALAKLGVELPGPWLDKLLLVVQWRFPSFPARLLSIVAWSTATLNHRPQQEWLMCFEEQVRAKFLDFTGHELACVAWSLRRFGYSTRNNAVFYMLQKQHRFLAADFEILSNPKLLRQVLGWKGEGQSGSASECGSDDELSGGR